MTAKPCPSTQSFAEQQQKPTAFTDVYPAPAGHTSSSRTVNDTDGVTDLFRPTMSAASTARATHRRLLLAARHQPSGQGPGQHRPGPARLQRRLQRAPDPLGCLRHLPVRARQMDGPARLQGRERDASVRRRRAPRATDTNLFPSLQSQPRLGRQGQVQAQLQPSHRSQSIQSYDPTVVRTSATSGYAGNPALKPQMLDAFEASYNVETESSATSPPSTIA